MLRTCIRLFICFLFCYSGAGVAAPPDLQLFVEPEAGRAPILQAIAEAHQEIDVVMYLWTDQKIANALLEAAHRGITVKVLLEKSPYESDQSNTWLPPLWRNTSLQWQWVPSSQSSLHYFHQKSLLIDHQTLWVMTLNFVKSSFNPKYPVRNFMVRDQQAADVESAQGLFDQDWQNKPVFSILPSALVVSPINSRMQLEKIINASRISLEIYTDGMDDYDLIGDLAHAAQRGVKVQIICGGKLQEKAKKYLTQAGVRLKPLDQNSAWKNHAKVMIADGNISYLGSENFTQNSLDDNRELGVLVQDGAIVQQLHQQFLRDWARD